MPRIKLAVGSYEMRYIAFDMKPTANDGRLVLVAASARRHVVHRKGIGRVSRRR